MGCNAEGKIQGYLGGKEIPKGGKGRKKTTEKTSVSTDLEDREDANYHFISISQTHPEETINEETACGQDMIPPQRKRCGCNMQCQVCESGSGLQGRGQATEAVGTSGRKAVNYEGTVLLFPSTGMLFSNPPCSATQFSTLQVHTTSSICALQLLWELSKHQNLTSTSQKGSTLNVSCSISSTPWDFLSHLAETVPSCPRQ